MVTQEQKEQLVEKIKWVPRSVEILLSGYGGEIVVGSIDQEVYDYWTDNEDDLEDYVFCFGDESSDVPEEYQFVEPGGWYNCDNLAHASNVEMSSYCSLVVRDVESGETLFESSLDVDELDDHEIELDFDPGFDISDQPEGTCVFVARSIEKGTFFGAEIVLDEPFDPKQLTISYSVIDGWTLCQGVMYRGEDLDGYQYASTTGKSLEATMYKND